MDWHTDNYEADPSLGDLEAVSVLNAVVTLKGSAEYSWKDPETGEIRSVVTKPGTVVLSRSGDIHDLPQVEHAVGPPIADVDGDCQRVALLLAFTVNENREEV
ncbi:hypothetical protein TM7_0152 [candidate division TM7 genomosp. GTL1]|nr:hypothetical protein TM7_0152 [candidate division TM7 genomosp. GTL1]